MKAKTTNLKKTVKWCPGCGDYAILASLQRLLVELDIAPENHVFVSGIGCAGRLPYYVNAYGFHTIHGRAAAIATGLKMMRPELTVWVITGDGDALSIGANHTLHLLRRNLDINIILFNNAIYGLTKGQYSPTSAIGSITKTSSTGVNVKPINPCQFALDSGASMVGRAMDKDPKHLQILLKEAVLHRGSAFIEVLQNCNIFNDGAFDRCTSKETRQDNALFVEDGKKMVYGDNRGLLWANGKLNPVQANQSSYFDITDSHLARAVATYEDPKCFGNLYQDISQNSEKPILPDIKGLDALEQLLQQKNTWYR